MAGFFGGFGGWSQSQGVFFCFFFKGAFRFQFVGGVFFFGGVVLIVFRDVKN